MEQVEFSEVSRAVHFGQRKLTPRACVIDSKQHLRTFLSDALEDLGFITSECGRAADLAGVLLTERPDLIVLSVCVDGLNVGDMLEAIVRTDFGGKVLVIGQTDSIMVKAVRQICAEYEIAMLAPLPTPFGPASLRDCVAELLPAEPAPNPAVDAAEALKAGWLELWYQQKISTHTLMPDGAEALVRMRHPTWGVVSPARFIPTTRIRISARCPNSSSSARSRTGAICWNGRARSPCRSICLQRSWAMMRRFANCAGPCPPTRLSAASSSRSTAAN